MAFTGGAPRPTSITAQKPSTRPGPGARPLGFSGPVRPNFGPGVGAPGPQGFSGPVRPHFGPGVGLPAPAAAPAPAPAAPAAPSASPPSPSGPASPLDSTYYGNLAANQFKVGNAINNLQRTAGYDNTALQSALDQLAYQQPRDQLKVEQNANRTGGLYSSVEAQNEGNLVHAYATRQNAAVTGNAQKLAAIQSQISALQGGVPIYEGQQYDDAVARAIKAAAANPATGQDTSAGSAPATAPPATAPAASVTTPPSSPGRPALPAAPRTVNGRPNFAWGGRNVPRGQLPGAWGSFYARQMGRR